MPPSLPPALDAALAALLGPDSWLTGEQMRRAHAEDDSRLSAMPDAVALPRDREQVAAIVRACRAHRVPVVARGAGTATTGAAVPFAGGDAVDAMSVTLVSPTDLRSVGFWRGVERMVAQRQLDLRRQAMRVTQVVRFDDGTRAANVAVYRRYQPS